MERLTEKRDDGTYFVAADDVECGDGVCAGAAVERLAAYENMHELVETQYAQAAEKLETFKAQGRLKTSQAQQLLAQKLTYSSMLNLIE